jgi:hypothetical protein
MGATRTTLRGALSTISGQLGPDAIIPLEAYTDPREDLLVRYVVGQGVINAAHHIAVTGKIYKLNGVPDGEHNGVDLPVVPLVQMFQPPPDPQPPFDQPTPPVDQVQVLSYTKGIWTFADGSTIVAEGPAQLRVIFYVDGASQLWVSGEQIITNGTGRFAGARGTKTVGGSSWVPAGQDPNQPGTFMVRTVEVFRVVLAENIAA